MSDIVFDKLTFVDRLKSGGISEDQARVHADALDTALREGVATKADVFAVKSDLEIAVTELKGELRLVKWMLALVIAATVIPLIRDFL